MTTHPPRSLSALLGTQITPLDDATAQRWRDAGWWEQRSIRSLLSAAAAAHPDRVALVGHRAGRERVTRTYTEFNENAHHAADVFAALGVSAGDTVALMLPNWVEYAEMVFGINEVGAIYTGIPVAYGEQQAAAILRASKAKVLVIPRRWRSVDHLELSRLLRAQIDTLKHVVLLDPDDAIDDELAEGESLWSNLGHVPRGEYPDPDPNRICYLGFTSGTTGAPKGAMHGHNSLIYSVQRQAAHMPSGQWGEPLVQLVASPVGHHTGYVWGIVFTVYMAGTGVHVDHWQPSSGARIIRDEKVTTFFGAPTFLQDIMQTDLVDDPAYPLTCLVIAGAPVPRNLPAQASAALGAYVAPAWGMTECSILTCCTPSEPDEIQHTDGSVFAGTEVKVVDADGAGLGPGEVGDLLVRGPGLIYGYYDRPDATADAFLPELWFRTGDRAIVDERGWVSLQGRTKDIIIRGGENVPVVDVESAVFDHPDVISVAVVGTPDERLGERICAVVVTKPGAEQLTVASLSMFLQSRGLSRHYLPERVVTLPELPVTPSGKIQKFKLREMLS